MKKTMLLILGVISFYIFTGNVMSKSNIKLNEAIRLRVVANSNSNYDQEVKMDIKKIVEKDLNFILKGVSTKEEAQEKIKNNLQIMDKKINNYFKETKYNLSYEVNYGLNHFPKKEYNGIIFKEGNYESLLITIGEGLGNNWWCIMYPPLCLVEVDEGKEVEYKSFVKEMLDKYL